jgi:putative FmdB family regulatory protein
MLSRGPFWCITSQQTKIEGIMPTYDYICKECTHEWEAEQSIKDEPLVLCPRCGKPEAKRLIGTTSFQLLGGGWYADGYTKA